MFHRHKGPRGRLRLVGLVIVMVSLLGSSPVYAQENSADIVNNLIGKYQYQKINKILTVSKNKEFTVQFNKAVDVNTINHYNVQLIEKPGSSAISCNLLAGSSNREVKVSPRQALQPGANYYLIVNRDKTVLNGSLADDPGNYIKAGSGNQVLKNGVLAEINVQELEVAGVELYDSITPGKKQAVVTLGLADPENYKVAVDGVELGYDRDCREFTGDVDAALDEAGVRNKVQITRK